MKFSRYFDSFLFTEMPRVMGKRRFFLDADDDSFLQPFIDYVDDNYGDKFDADQLERLKAVVVSQAIRYRYSSDVLQRPEPSVRDVKIDTTFERTKGKKDFQPIRFVVTTDTKASKLIEKFDTLGYDVSKINLKGPDGRIVSNRVAKEWLDMKAGRGSKVPEMSPAYAQKDYVPNQTQTTGGRKPLAPKVGGFGSANAVDHRGDVKLKEPIKFDADDEAFLKAFVDQGAPQERVKALMKRYSGRLVNDKNVSPDGKTMMWPISGKKGKEDGEEDQEARKIPIPVNIPALKRRLDDLKDKGVNFYDHPLPRVSAMRWLERGQYSPGHKARSSVETAAKAAGGKFTMLQKWIDDQNAHLMDPDTVKSPNIPSRKYRGSSEDMNWMDILEHDAEAGAKMALKFMQSKTKMSLNDIQLEDLTFHALDLLSSDEAVSRPDYANQDERINMASRAAMTFISNYIKDHRKDADTEMGAIADRKAADRFTAPTEKEAEAEAEKARGKIKIPTEDEAEEAQFNSKLIPVMKQYLQNDLKADTEFEYDDDTLKDAAIMLGKMVAKLQELNPGENMSNPAMADAVHKMASDIVAARKNKPVSIPDVEPKVPVPTAAVDAMKKSTPTLAANEPPKPKKIAGPEAELKPASVVKPSKPTEFPPPGFKWGYDDAQGKWVPVRIGTAPPKKAPPKPTPGLFDDLD